MVENIAEDIVLEEYLSDDKLNIILDRVNGWIDNCDSKVSTILSGVGIIAGIFLATDYVKKIISIIQTAYKCDNVWARIYLMVSAISIIFLIIGVCMLISTLFARVNPKAFEKKNTTYYRIAHWAGSCARILFYKQEHGDNPFLPQHDDPLQCLFQRDRKLQRAAQRDGKKL